VQPYTNGRIDSINLTPGTFLIALSASDQDQNYIYDKKESLSTAVNLGTIFYDCM